MSLCGILGCEVKFNHPFTHTLDPELLPVNFEGAVQLMARVFKIDPLVFRLANHSLSQFS